MAKSNVLFVSHGGGPLPLLGDARHSAMIENLQGIVSKIGRPQKVVVVSAHWEEPMPTVTGHPKPALIYDYYGFAKEAYEIAYPAVGDPTFAAAISQALERANIASAVDNERGFDHGMYVPLKIMYPDADIPCVQVSLKAGLDAGEHINIGAALAPVLSENTLVLGSGFSFHNLKAFFSGGGQEIDQKNEEFEQWLVDTCTTTSISEEERQSRLINWSSAPSANYCHPRAEHLIPLHVCYGVAQSASSEHFELRIMNKKSSVYLWRI